MPATVSLISEPDYLSPVNAEMFYQTNSDDAQVYPDYKYIFDVYKLYTSTGTIESLLARYKVPARPVSFDGILSVNRILKNQISNDGPNIIYFDATSPTTVTRLYTRYQTYYGFEYNPNLSYYDIGNVPGFGIYSTYSLGLEVGDTVTISKTNTISNPQYNGEHIVGSMSSGPITISGLSFSVYWYGIDGTFGSSTPNGYDGGLITNILRIQDSGSKRLGYNGTRQYLERYKDFTSDYLMGLTMSASGKFLTNYIGYKPIGPNEYEIIDMMHQLSTTLIKLELKTYDSGMNLINTYSVNKGISSTYKYSAIPIGTRNLKTTFSNTNIFNGVTYYTLSLQTTPGSQFSELVKRKINYNCSLYDDVRIIFLNRMGGYDFWTFNKDNKKTVNINRTEFKKTLDPFYTIGDRGYTTLHQNIDYTYSLNSDWISEYDYSYLEELITSPNIYIQMFDETNSPYLLPINITDTSYQLKTQLRDKLFNLTINYKYSNPVNIQNA